MTTGHSGTAGTTQVEAKTTPPRGMRDLLPNEVALRDWATAVIIHAYQQYGFTRIETPALENINLLRRGEGGENLQLIYEVLKRGDKLDKVLKTEPVDRDELSDLGLRFDLTVPLVRYYANNIANLPNPLKAIQIGSVWRAESPQQGRFRQFTQCDIDIIGVKGEAAEIELIQATADAILGLGFEDFEVRINDRRVLSAIAEHCGFPQERHSGVYIALDKLDKIQIDGVKKELEKEGHDGLAIANLASLCEAFQKGTGDELSFMEGTVVTVPSEVVSSLRNVIDTIAELSGGKYSVRFDPTLVRGMGYYTGQIFEIAAKGYGSSVGGGGRYDKMVGKLLGRDVPACGFSIGFERIIGVLADKAIKPGASTAKIALIYEPARDPAKAVLKAAATLRSQGQVVSLLPRKKDMTKQLDALKAEGFTGFCAFRGEGASLEIKQLG